MVQAQRGNAQGRARLLALLLLAALTHAHAQSDLGFARKAAALEKKDKLAVTLDAPAAGTVLTAPAVITLSATAVATVPNHPIEKVEFFAGATLIGVATAPVSGSQYSVQWSAVPYGSYSLTARGTNTSGDVDTSDPVQIVVNAPPSIAITSPASGAVLAPGTFAVTAAASDPDGTIARVDFYSGATHLGTATAAPYRIEIPDAAPGTYSFAAVATDDRGAQAASAPVAVRVNAPPSVALQSPAAGALVTAPATFTLTASASDADGAIARVDFYTGATLLGSSTSEPHAFTWPNVGPGRYALRAVATDNDGATASSATIDVRVNAPPVIALTSPAPNASLNAPASIALSAEASDFDGSIAQIEFFSGSTLIATLTTPPYAILWTGVPQGTYILTARATDDLGAAVISSSISVTVAAAAQAKLYFIHVDHLNTPRLIADATGAPVWRWDMQELFGNNVPDSNPTGIGTFDVPLRFPGQYFDKETNLHYNFYRDFDPAIGRYIQSDPIGLAGGINTFTYVKGDPLNAIDFFGLMRTCGTGTIGERTTPNTFFLPCCQEHDDCYDDCKHLPSKDSCDREFNACTMRQCANRWAAIKFVCESLALGYQGAMHTQSAQRAFDNARASCRCNPSR
ncbi:MAG TPA: Ig-like domain-containing protein [Burkholderiales bacterium]|nr:Ig-like domain-containing protein [Burkholderiales bacterium]